MILVEGTHNLLYFAPTIRVSLRAKSAEAQRANAK